ncbi:AfsR/SARP family transcriptional regulator [Actinophytocola oryzae]|uniref:DNA-binding SARP family transcriptional activator n=1 Tax=Actinophytocola oryzae TaxID=502181 RepID=A0A4R7VI38_9PSEU|nr:BTAD domain-containing putative transcriptional regulator [Actinophytocola oryzae]TDV48837.1 DNA-binding SARP family transcriptional activator [Actinophytocola oryzae]
MKFRLLGPVEVDSPSGPVALPGVKPRALLAALLLEHGRTVHADRLMSVVWGENPPNTARAVLQTYVATLRRMLVDAGLPPIITSDRQGYRAEIPEDTLDVRVFERHVARGRQSAQDGNHAEAREILRTGLALWRGPALGGIGEAFLRAEAARLDELRLTVTEERVDADLAAGQGPQLLAELTELVTLHPTRERLRGALMVALYRAGRQTDALEVYEQGRQALADELGIDPGPELRQVHESILRCDTALLPAVASRTPRQLPSPPPDFTGREPEIDELRTALVRQTTMPVGVVSGAGGVGKSTLAHRVAHEIAGHFPDGQYHLELHGSTASPVTAEEVLGRVLRDFDPTTTVPGSLDERVARYRTLLAGTRTLVVLDDAANEAQVRPLLPGTPGCAVLITSRNRLSALAAATFVELGVLPADVAVDLFTRIVGADRSATEPAAAAEITRLCGRLPLAIRIAGARLVSRRQWSLSRLASRLAREQHRLDELAVGDQQVRASIELSYALLPEPARTALRRLGLLGLPHFPAWVAASALEIDVDDAERVLEDLVDVSLLEIDGVDSLGLMRYQLHDLVRLFALERAVEEELPKERAATVERVLGGWIWLVERINESVPLVQPSIQPTFRLGRSVDHEIAGRVVASPYEWFRAEEEALTTAVELAATLDLDAIAVELATALSGTAFGGHHRVLDDPFGSWQRTHDAALSAARRNDNALGEAALLAGLGQLYYERDDFPKSRAYLSQAQSVFRGAGDLRGEATTLAALGAACREQGYLPEALHFLDRAGRMWAALAESGGMGHVQRLTGTVRLEMGDYPGTYTALTEARSLFVAAGSRRGEGLTTRSLSLYHRARGEWAQAEELARAALSIFEQTEDRILVAYSERALAKALLRLGDSVTALRLAEHALEVCRTLADAFGHACTLRVVGEIHLADGRLYQAKDCLEDSLRRWTDLHTELFRARTMHTLASVHDALGDAPTARRMSMSAMETFRTYGAREYTELSSAS